ncbi:hypothetical protein KC19_2G223100 [Ceratodon purpureus]|uniref:Secreted protein n=1 Tax=Ceratodon purpureus TaxID=3225 RepID=A0A8T0IY67_CERPU|nr:hypothetical protein KC19_2G223100 [Ceratodon purpureus]
MIRIVFSVEGTALVLLNTLSMLTLDEPPGRDLSDHSHSSSHAKNHANTRYLIVLFTLQNEFSKYLLAALEVAFLLCHSSNHHLEITHHFIMWKKIVA